MYITQQQNQAPSTTANVMDMINQYTQPTSSSPALGSQSLGGLTSDPYVSLLGKVADTQSLMARTMEMAFNTINNVMNFAMSFMFNSAGQGANAPALASSGLQGFGQLSGLNSSTGTQLPLPSDSSGGWLDNAINFGKDVWSFLESDTGSSIIDGVKDFGSSIWGGVKDIASSAWDSVKGFGSSIVKSIPIIGGLF